MKIRVILSYFILFFALQPGVGMAFVPQAPHLLHLVVQKIKQPVGILAFQTRTIVDCESIEREDQVSLQEKLVYKYPNQLRAEIMSDTATSFNVESGFKFIKVRNGQIISRSKSLVDLYTDVLLYRNYENLLGQLVLAGIDVTEVSFQRYQDTICYVIGSPKEKGEPFSGLWIEKETFFPMKYIVEKDDIIVECRYSNWQKISKTWYPMQISILLDNKLFATIDVNEIDLNAAASSSIFNISHIEQLYPEKKVPEILDEEPENIEVLNRRIEELKKIYE